MPGREEFMPESVMGRPIEILLVEDRASDAFLTREAFANDKLLHKLHLVENGVCPRIPHN